MTAKLTDKQKQDRAAAAAARAAGKDAVAGGAAKAAAPPPFESPTGPKVRTPEHAGAKVTIACKLAVGWFDLQLCTPKEVQENTQTGPRTVTQWFRTGKVVRVRGTAFPRGTPPEGYPEKPRMVGGYAMTDGVDRDFWDAWVKQNAKAPMVINQVIFACENADAVRGQATELSGIDSGMEPMRQDKDPRVPRSTNKHVTEVETEENRRGKAPAVAV